MKERRRWLFIGLTLLGSLLVIEGVLQLAGLVARQASSRAQLDPHATETIRILCVGDSHTFGLPLPEEDSYPAQLEVALALRHPDVSFEVVNLGIPGLNSAFVANRLERQLHQLSPDLVIVWVGINNLWNVVERGEQKSGDRWLPLRATLLNLRLFRLASIAWFNATGHQYDPAARGGWHEGEASPSGRLPPGVDLPDPAPGLGHDLARIVTLTASLDTPVLFVTYPLKGSQPISRVIRRAGNRLGVAVIDTRAELERAKRDGHGEPDLVDFRSGPHPSRLLYGYVVEAMVPVVEATLDAWHGYGLGETGTAMDR